MKLNRLERHTAYIIMLAEAEARTDYTTDGFCWMAYHLFRLEDVCKNFDHSLRIFPELEQKRPRNLYGDYGLWFTHEGEGWRKRIELLKQCIEETY